MSEQPTEAGAPQPEVKLGPADLARSWLGYRGAEVQREIASTEKSLEFNRNFKPTPPSPRPHPEDGGMDHADWEVAMGEYNQWPEEQEELIEYGEGKLEQLHDDMSTILDNMDRVDRGETGVIEQFARLETERRAKLEEQRQRKAEQERKAAERKVGKEFDGTQEVVAQLDEVMGLAKAGTLHESTKRSQGWKVGRYWRETEHTWGGLPMKNPERLLLEYDTREGYHDVPELSISVSPLSEGGYGLYVEDLRHTEEIDHVEGYGKKARKGRFLSVRVKGDRGTDYTFGDLIEKRPYGYPEYETKTASNGEEFGDSQFQEVRGLVNAASTDLKAATAQPQQ